MTSIPHTALEWPPRRSLVAQLSRGARRSVVREGAECFRSEDLLGFDSHADAPGLGGLLRYALEPDYGPGGWSGVALGSTPSVALAVKPSRARLLPTRARASTELEPP
jgi:hypothetical protein